VFGALQGDWLENSQEEDQFVPEVGCKYFKIFQWLNPTGRKISIMCGRLSKPYKTLAAYEIPYIYIG